MPFLNRKKREEKTWLYPTELDITRRPRFFSVSREELQTIKENAQRNPEIQIQLFDSCQQLIPREAKIEVPENRKAILKKFRQTPFMIPAMVPTPTIQRINPLTEFENQPPLYFGIEGGRKELSKGLPFDVLAMLLVAEKLGQDLGLGERLILFRDRLTSTNIGPEFTPEAIKRVLTAKKKILEMVLERFGFAHWQTIFESDLAKNPDPEKEESYEKLLADTNTVSFLRGDFCSLEIANVSTLLGQGSGGIKLGWRIGGRFDRFPYPMDEQLFDVCYILYSSLRNKFHKTSFAYTRAGVRLFSEKRRLERVPPYICYQPPKRILLKPFEDAIEKFNFAREAGGGFRYRETRALFGGITSLYEELVLGEEIPIPQKESSDYKGQQTAQKVSYILQNIFNRQERKVMSIWEKAFPTAL